MKNLIHAMIITSVISASAYAGATDNSIISREKKLVRKLYGEKRYFDSIAEARRLQVEDDSPEIDYFIYMNYFLAEQYRTVTAGYDHVHSSLGICAGTLVSMSYLKLGMYDESFRSLSPYNYTGDSGRDMELFIRRLGPLILSGDIHGIKNEEISAEPFLRDDYGFVSLREELARFRGAGFKSPVKGAILSALVPGLGQAYSGYYTDAFISLASVAATALGGVYMRDTGRDGYSCTLFFFSGLFHAGNIYGAWNSAVRRNRSITGEEYSLINSRYGEYNPEECIDIERILR